MHFMGSYGSIYARCVLTALDSSSYINLIPKTIFFLHRQMSIAFKSWVNPCNVITLFTSETCELMITIDLGICDLNVICKDWINVYIV